MKTENYTKSIKSSFDKSRRFRWGLLISITGIFIIILYPKLLMPKHSYQIGDIAERVFENLGKIVFEIGWSLSLKEKDFNDF